MCTRVDDHPHTGAMRYDDAVQRVPAAAISTRGADELALLLRAGKQVRVHLELDCESLPDAPSSNVVGELRGSELPDEIVLTGAHLDCWDVSPGAHDDGAGCAQVLEALRLLRLPGVKLKRTVRAVLFMNEENGLRGGEAYAKDHAAEVGKHVAALEADSGSGRPLSIQVHGGAGAADLLRPWALPLATLGCEVTAESADAGGADMSPLAKVADAVPMVSVRQDSSRYFDLHHSAADTLDKVKPFELAQAAAAFAWTTFALAEMPGTLPRPEAKPAAATK